jgi:hypothetical protein
VPSSTDLRLDELCRLALPVAAAKGHELREWTTEPEDGEHARHTTCSRCGRSLYVRVGAGMSGMSGPALTETCG